MDSYSKMSQLNQDKEKIVNLIEQVSRELISLSHKIHKNPEGGFKEIKASKWLSDFLKKKGFKVKKGVCSLPTAFSAEFKIGVEKKKSPSVAFIAEYDALPVIGHGCGHNIIGPASCGAAYAVKKVLSEKKIPAVIKVIGTPAEEGGGGKVKMIEKNFFKDIDAAMMIHPDIKTRVRSEFLANRQVKFHFYGKSSHAAASPHEGVNALDAVILTFNNINALRQQLREDVKVHGIITDGGVKPNIIPDYASCWFYVRTREKKILPQVYKKILNCASAAAKATGCRIKIEEDEIIYYPMKHNECLEDVFRENLKILKEPENLKDIRGTGSSDIGNLSQIVPTIHPNIKIGEGLSGIHSEEFCRAAISKSADEGLLKGAKALAMTAYDIIVYPEKLKKIKSDFRKKK
ncbi:MAG: M20 family peptidase [Candidatus Schekmanbacteria bacterium]|nr:MAG: M20 family peptidase [Candidatus Schekmanbacteria bacterium]